VEKEDPFQKKKSEEGFDMEFDMDFEQESNN